MLAAQKNARFILPVVLELLPPVHSVVDFGCGTGGWLAMARELGVGEIKGLDGSWVAPETLDIPGECFTAVDLEKEVAVDKRYDLAISLEVAEHLPEASAEGFVQSLVNAADIILFSAAIPGQGGTNHVNEQWPAYWSRLFDQHGYVAVDTVRRKIWFKADITAWSKQNILLYVKKERLGEIKAPREDYCEDHPPMGIVLGELFQRVRAQHVGEMALWPLWKVALKRTGRRFLGERLTLWINRYLRGIK